MWVLEPVRWLCLMGKVGCADGVDDCAPDGFASEDKQAAAFEFRGYWDEQAGLVVVCHAVHCLASGTPVARSWSTKHAMAGR